MTEANKPMILDASGNPIVSERRINVGASYGDAKWDAASQGPEMRTWNPGKGSGDTDTLWEFEDAGDRGKDLVRNEPLARSAIATEVNNVVGANGLQARPTPDYRALGKTKEWADEWGRTTGALFREHFDSVDIDASRTGNGADLTRLVYKTKLVQGSAVALPVWLPNRGTTTWGLAISLVDPDRLSNPLGMPDSETMRKGVEIGEWGEPLAYHIQKTHPADIFLGAAIPEWERVEAFTSWGRRRVLHVFDRDQIGQHRGMTAFASVMREFKSLHDYKGAELQAAVANALIAAFVESPLDAQGIRELFGDDVNSYLTERSEHQVRLKTGSVIPLFPGEKLSSFNPARPSTLFSPFVETVIRSISAGLGLPFELVSKDFSKVNYSSLRASLLEAWRTFATSRAWLVRHWAQPIYELWLEEAVQRGIVEAPGYYERRGAWSRCRWLGAGRGWIDEVREAQAAQLRLATGLSTLEEECAQQGRDWEEVLEQRATEQRRMRELGLDMSTIQTSVSVAPQVPVEQSDDGDTSEEMDDWGTDENQDDVPPEELEPAPGASVSRLRRIAAALLPFMQGSR